MNRKVLLVVAAVILLALIVVVLAVVLLMNRRGEKSQEYKVSEVENLQTIETQLEYENAYNGPLFASSEKTGSEADFSKLFENMERNGVNQAVLYFGYESDGSIESRFNDELEMIIDANKKWEGRVITYYSTGIGGNSEGDMAGEELTGIYKNGYESLEKSAPGIVKGIGEIEIYAWDMSHNDPKVEQLIKFAEEKSINVMLHPSRGKLNQFEELVKNHPETTFIFHMFQPDFQAERETIIKLLQDYENLYYTIDADHLMFDTQAKIGLLYKYQDSNLQQAKSGFLNDFRQKSVQMLVADIKIFGPMVEKVPDKVVWGTEMHEEYTYDSEVYDRMIELSRRFIGSFDEDIQEKLAYKNAQKIFGYGLEIR